MLNKGIRQIELLLGDLIKEDW